ncbi:hypothetical protein ACTFIR_007403 [Dictyostelium discoideum]
MITKVEYLINPDNQFNNGPISIILGYAGSTLRILKNYAKIWHDRGFNAILSPHSIDTSCVFYEEMELIIFKYLEDYFKNKNNKRMICFHVLSAGSLFLGKLLESMKKKNEFNYLFSLIKGVVYDSAPLLDENDSLCGTLSVAGVNIFNINENFVQTKIDKLFLESFFHIWKKITTIYYSHLTSPLNKWPHLILTSPNDFVILSIYDFIDQIKLIPGMKEFKDFKNSSGSNNNNNNCFNNLYIIEKVFQSEHCLHLLKNPKEYIESVNQLIDLAFLNEKNQLQSLIKL